MLQSAETGVAFDVEPLMTLATARRQDWLPARVASHDAGGRYPSPSGQGYALDGVGLLGKNGPQDENDKK